MAKNHASIVFFHLGAHMRTGMTDVQQTFRVKALYKHSGFTMRQLKHDIAPSGQRCRFEFQVLHNRFDTKWE